MMLTVEWRLRIMQPTLKHYVAYLITL